MPTHMELTEKFRQWASLRAQNDLVSSRMNKLRDDLMAAVIADGDQDERGNTHLTLPTPVSVGEKQFSGIKREARTTVTLNDERAMALAHEKGLQSELIIHEPRIDLDALYAAWQRGKITEEELDAVFDTKTTYAFKTVTS